MALPNINAAGRLTRDPEIRATNTGKQVAKFSLATSDRKRDPSGNWVDGDRLFINCEAWGWQAEQAADLRKGDPVVVLGTLKDDSYERDGQKKPGVKISVRELGVTPRSRPTDLQRQAAGVPGAWQTTDDEPPF